MNNAPKEITTPPKGYEWVGELRPVVQGEYGAHWDSVIQKWYAVQESQPGTTTIHFAILRKLKSPTVMVELPRDTVQWWSDTENWITKRSIDIHEACRKALDQEDSNV